MNTYDIMFIFPATLTEEAYDKLFTAAQGEITKAGGSIERVDRMGRRPFARPIHKRAEGLYGRLWAKLDPSHVDAIVARFNLNEEILRVQVRRIEGGVPPVPVRATSAVSAERERIPTGEGARDGEPQ